MDCDTEETRETRKLYNKSMGKYNISGEDKDRVLAILDRLEEAKDSLEKRIDYSLEPYYYQNEIYCLNRLKKILGEEEWA